MKYKLKELNTIRFSNNHAELFILDIRNLKSNDLLIPTQLPDEELCRYQKFIHNSDKNMFVAGRLIARSVLSSYLKTSNNAVLFDYQNGKPYLSSNYNSRVQFNISHSQNIVMVAFHPEFNIGIDIEKIVLLEDIDTLAKTVFTTNEIKHLNNRNSVDKVNEFYRIWVIKEAILKCTGQGLYMDPKCIDTTQLYSINDVDVITLDNSNHILITDNFNHAHPWALCLESKPDSMMINQHRVKLEEC